MPSGSHIAVYDGYDARPRRRHRRRRRASGRRRGGRRFSSAMVRQQSVMKECASYWREEQPGGSYKSFIGKCLRDGGPPEDD